MTTQTMPVTGTEYTPGRRWAERISELTTFLEVHRRLPARSEWASTQGAEHSLASWLHVQQIAFRRGELSATRRNTLEQLHPMSLGQVAAPLIRQMPKTAPKPTAKELRAAQAARMASVAREAKEKSEARNNERRSRAAAVAATAPKRPRKGWLQPETAWDKAWIARFEEVSQTLSKPASCLQTTDHDYIDATKWVSYQRVKHQRHPFAPWRLEMFEQRFPGKLTAPLRGKTNWDQNLRCLQAHIDEYGDLPSRARDSPVVRLASWVRNQKHRMVTGTLSGADAARFEAVLKSCPQ